MRLGLLLGLGVFVLFGALPAVLNVVMSFTDYTSLPGVDTNFVGLANYHQLVTSQLPGFKSSLSATVEFVVGVTVIQNAIGLALAHRLQHESKTASTLRMLAFVPIVLGATVVGLAWLLLFSPGGGPMASVFGAFGIHSAFFGSSSSAMLLVIAVQVWQNLGFSMIVFIGGLKSIPRSVYEAAALDGVTSWSRFTRITWPLLAPSVTINILLAVIGSLTTYNLLFVLTRGNFGTNTLGIFAFNSAFGPTANLGLGAAVTSVLFLMAAFVALPVALLLRLRERRILS